MWLRFLGGWEETRGRASRRLCDNSWVSEKKHGVLPGSTVRLHGQLAPVVLHGSGWPFFAAEGGWALRRSPRTLFLAFQTRPSIHKTVSLIHTFLRDILDIRRRPAFPSAASYAWNFANLIVSRTSTPHLGAVR